MPAPQTPQQNTRPGGDRFIPSRSALNVDSAGLKLRAELNEQSESRSEKGNLVSPSKEEYRKALADNLVDGNPNAKILAYKHKPPAPPASNENSLAKLYTANKAGAKPKRQARQIPQAPERILDAPDLVDDYYLNTLDWGSSNTLAVALDKNVYLWNAASGTIEELLGSENANEPVTSVKWAADGKHLAVGMQGGDLRIYDAQKLKKLRTMGGHSGRLPSLSWNGSTLSSGSRDNTIGHHDVRVQSHLVSRLTAHSQEVCGLAWSHSGQHLASGANDNLVHIFDQRGVSRNRPLHRLESHQAAVKAMAWCPFQANLLATGGGTSDRCIKFWNVHTGALLNSVDTESQVCALEWNSHERELLSSHGYSQNQLTLWRYPSMSKAAELTGHTQRVLQLSQSPDGRSVASAAADETLRFWRCFGEPADKAASKPAGALAGSSFRSSNIR